MATDSYPVVSTCDFGSNVKKKKYCDEMYLDEIWLVVDDYMLQ